MKTPGAVGPKVPCTAGKARGRAGRRPRTAMPGEGRDVLVVDDDALFRETLVPRLEAWGFGARTAPNVESAVELLEDLEPAAVLVDLVLPGRSGLDLLREIGSRPVAPPAVLITAHGGLREAREALLEGAEDVLTKPVLPERLRAVLDTVVAGGTRSAPYRPAEERDVPPARIDGRGRVVTIELPLGGWARRAERDLLVETLEATDGDEAEAARRMNLPVAIFRTKLSRYE